MRLEREGEGKGEGRMGGGSEAGGELRRRRKNSGRMDDKEC